MYECDDKEKGYQGWSDWGSMVTENTVTPPRLSCQGLAGRHQQVITFKCKLDRGERWKHGNKLDISIGGVQLEKMSISY